MIKLILLLFVPFIVFADDKLAYLEYVDDYWQVFVSDNTGKNPRQVTFSEYDKSTISWSAAGEAIFISGIQGQAELLYLGTNEIKKLHLPHSHVNDAVISPMGTHIAYSAISIDESDNKLWLYKPGDREAAPLNHEVKGRQYDPQWSPDGKYIYYVSGDAENYYNIRRSHIDTGASEILISNNALNLDIAVAENKLIYSSNVMDGYDIWVLDGQKYRRLTDDPVTEASPAWAESRQGVYYVKVVNGVSNIWFKKIDSPDKPEQITYSKTGARKPTVYNGDAE